MIAALAGTSWSGTCELWLDPLGDEGITSEAGLRISEDRIDWSWSHEGEDHEGSLIADGSGGAMFTDTFHAPGGLQFEVAPDSWAAVDVRGTYPAGDGPEWGWRTTLVARPKEFGGGLVLQMTNVAPWGEHIRATRFVLVPV